jgi:hypothetical protein
MRDYYASQLEYVAARLGFALMRLEERPNKHEQRLVELLKQLFRYLQTKVREGETR